MHNEYGILTKISRDINCGAFGDCSGSTISRRTTKGLKKITGLTMPDQKAEVIVHAAMIGVLATYKKNRPLSFLLLLMLFLSYHAVD